MNRAHAQASAVGEARLRAEVAQAADILFPAWPLSTFIAVNPLGNLSRLPFAEATAQAERALGSSGYPRSEQLRQARDEGRIADVDLEASIARARAEGRLSSGLGAATDLLGSPPEVDPAPQPDSASEALDGLDGGDRRKRVDAEVAKWCAAYLDEGESSWPMPGRELGFYLSWRQIAAVDSSARRLGAGDLREAAAALPNSAVEALTAALADLGVEKAGRVPCLRRLLARNHGWASTIRWQSERRHRPEHPIDLVQYLAVMSFYERAIASIPTRAEASTAQPIDDPERAGERERLELWLDAYEWHYRDRLLAAMPRQEPRSDGGRRRPTAQAVFCIDARSEGLRRNLEREGDYETLGFAGFFGLAVRHRGLGTGPDHGSAQCPVLLSPAAESTEQPLPGSEAAAGDWVGRRRSEAAAIETFHQVKNDLSSKFALAELSGWAFGPAAALRTLAPGAWRSPEHRRPPTAPVIDRPSPQEAEAMAAELERQIIAELVRAHLGSRRKQAEHELERLRTHAVAAATAPERPSGCSRRSWAELLEALPGAGLGPREHEDRVERIGAVGLGGSEQAQWARVALTMMGLTEGFGRLVLLCGHGAANLNNPFRSSLDCGACGGNQGGPNARLAAALLNSEMVRADLAEASIEIPADCRFIAGQHDTTTDRVEIFDREQLPVTHRADLLELERDLATAGESLAAERLQRLGDAPRRGGPRAAARRRSRDWAQVRPEWGLARNAAFIVGPREISAGLDLECRAFLHSYRAEVDPEGVALETILTAPLVVAEWINLQYYFSTVDPERFGAGDKTVHNVVGRRGVQLGPGGDLRIGLPRQAVFAGSRPYHEPMRLLAIVQAPLRLVSEIIDRNAVLGEMLGGGWAAMCARGEAGEPWQRLRRDLRWEPWRAADPNLSEEQTATDGGERWVAMV